MKTNNQFFLSRIDGISTRFGFINRIVNQIADKILPKAIAQAAGCVPANCWATNAECVQAYCCLYIPGSGSWTNWSVNKQGYYKQKVDYICYDGWHGTCYNCATTTCGMTSVPHC